MRINVLVNLVGVIFIIIGSVIAVSGLLVLLYFFVFKRGSAKRQIKDLERKYSYLDALLIGQDSQYIHRIEIVSRTNLLYVDIYNDFSRRFKEIYEIDDKFADSKIKQAKLMIANKKYKNIRVVIDDVKKAVQTLEDNVNALDKDLYQVIKPEEELRQQILKLKEAYRAVKQTFYASSSDLELVISSFNKAFDKLETTFTEFETHIDSAEYDDATNLLPIISNVVNALKSALEQMPNLCILVTKIIPNDIDELSNKYTELERSGYPLFHLSFRTHSDDWNYRISQLKKKLVALQITGAHEECSALQEEILEMSTSLDKEVNDKKFFNENDEVIYKKVAAVEKAFLKICSMLPNIQQVYRVDNIQQEQVEVLKENINKLGVSKRSLDAFIHSSTPQPFSILRSKLETLTHDLEVVESGVRNFKGYLESLKTSSDEAYHMVFAYYYRLREAEFTLRSINIPAFAKNYEETINNCYDLLNEIDKNIKMRPIDVALVNEKVETLKSVATNLFEEIDNKYTECQLAEGAVVFANRDRNQQTQVDEQLTQLEKRFFEGDFEGVYHDATQVFKRSHVED